MALGDLQKLIDNIGLIPEIEQAEAKKMEKEKSKRKAMTRMFFMQNQNQIKMTTLVPTDDATLSDISLTQGVK